MNTHRLVPITLALLCLVALAGAKCTKTEENQFLYALTGKVPDETGVLVYPSSSEPVALVVEESSSEEVVSVAAVVEPEPSSEYVPVAVTVCDDDWLWRGEWQKGACHVEYH